VEVGTGYAKNSAYAKKEERLNEALKFASSFYQRYPTSGFTGKVKDYEVETKEELAEHQKLKKEIADRLAAQNATIISAKPVDN
jgi:outer membrane protein assembly factor BamD